MSELRKYYTYVSYPSGPLPLLKLSPQEIIRPQDPLNRHFLDLVRQLLDFDPSLRITVRRAQDHAYFSAITPNDA